MFKWTASKINAANYCRMRYYLRYIDPLKPKPERLSAYVKGSLLHELIEKFWEKLGVSDEIKRNKKGQIISKKKYFDTEGFVNYAQGKWTSILMADERAQDKIVWRDKDEKWVIKSGLFKICNPLFPFLKEEGPPLFSEFAIDVYVNGRYYHGRIDEIRKKENKIIIRDWKSGSPWVGAMKLKHDPQLTF